jgi:hypothetical protein
LKTVEVACSKIDERRWTTTMICVEAIGSKGHEKVGLKSLPLTWAESLM